ncbi:lasso peptide biosynthesis B2 protein [uncultured Jatrophihabitans sp.]|uniref:lasso peptide biosynthesis B2 protein n=1 Tax=uncultured Jatrophihabitans sp. TaxID=1610747 RepID=UPI0035C98AAE
MLLAETALSLFVAWLLISAFPFRAAVRFYRLQRGTNPGTVSPAQMLRAEHIGWAVRTVSARVPWTCTCLMQSLVGAVLLRRRGLGSTLHLGVAKAKARESLEAHSWLICGDEVLTGASQLDRYVSVGTFTARC